MAPAMLISFSILVISSVSCSHAHTQREVATLSRLQHQHIVRYYQAWFETGITVSCDDSSCGSRTVVSSSFSYVDRSVSDHLGQDNKLESTYLYIQMEYCPRFFLSFLIY
ncbi:hypothetical protein EJD97_009737 [Solanum chilense]|uniref:Uncharacterized protein n=1 Tax=Solanum chilense TaxID=4083 RepID=A0A6N2BJ98_SOLCI|nr:hypothetical protein EJD97_009737 [Solanum chilense]